MTLRNIPRKRYLDPLPPSAQLVYRCRVCDWTNFGWCLLADPRIVVGLCLGCADEKRIKAKGLDDLDRHVARLEARV